MQKISIAIPVFNEEENIFELYQRLRNVLKEDFATYHFEILFVDDGSTDNTFFLLEELHQKDSRVKIVQLSRNFGHHIALTACLDYADGDYIVTMDGDLQDQPEEMIKLFRKLQEGYDVVFGDRQKKKFSFFKKTCSNLFFLILRFLVEENIIINSHVFRILKKQVVDEIKKLRELNRYVIGLIGWVGFKHASVPVAHGARFKGETKYTFRQRIGLATTAIFAFSDYPLKLIIYVGFMLVILSFFLVVYIISRKLLYGIPVMGWASLISSIFCIGGIQIFLLGILGKYLGGIYMETKKRPLYIVRTLVSKKS